MIDPQTTDLNEPGAPEHIPGVLRRAATKMREQAAELRSAHQDRHAGAPWLVIAAELDRAAARIETKL